MHRASEKLKNAVIENLKYDLQGEDSDLIVAYMELGDNTQSDVIESSVIRVIQNDRGLEIVRVFDIEYNVERNSINLWYIDIEKSVIIDANKLHCIPEDDKYDLLFELDFDTLSDFSEEPLTFLFDSEVSADEILGTLKEAK